MKESRTFNGTLIAALVFIGVAVLFLTAVPIVKCPECGGSRIPRWQTSWPCEACRREGKVTLLRSWRWQPTRVTIEKRDVSIGEIVEEFRVRAGLNVAVDRPLNIEILRMTFVVKECHAKVQKNGNRQEYVHYRCTGWKNGGKVCPGSRISERDLVAQLGEPLKHLQIDGQAVAEIKTALRDSFASERGYHKSRQTALRSEGTRLKTWIEKAYTDRLEGLITPEEFREKSAGWRSRQLEIQNELRAHTVADGKYLDEADRILDLAQRAHAIYEAEEDNFTRRRLELVAGEHAEGLGEGEVSQLHLVEDDDGGVTPSLELDQVAGELPEDPGEAEADLDAELVSGGRQHPARFTGGEPGVSTNPAGAHCLSQSGTFSQN